MSYFNNNFWRMIAGFTFILIMAMGVLLVVQYYSNQEIPVETYIANPETDSN